MRWLVLALSSAIGLLALPGAGCSDLGSGPIGGAGGTGARGGSAGTGDGGVGGDIDRVTVFVRVFEANVDGGFPPAPTGPPLEGVLVCELNNADNCTTTDADGKFALSLPQDQETGYSLEKAGFGSRIIPDVTDEGFRTENIWEMFTDAQLTPIAEQIGTDYPWAGGIPGINFEERGVGSQSVPGLSVSILDSTGKPFYLEDHASWLYSPDLDETQSGAFAGFLPLALAGFAEVPPGVREFEVVGGMDCQAGQAWPGSTPNRIRLPIVEGFNTYGSMGCALP